MYWVIQEDIFQEKKYTELVDTLVRWEIPHSIHKVVPFSGDIIPDVDPKGPVMVMGSYSMRHVSKRKGWTPGVIEMDNHQFFEQKKAGLGRFLLNEDAKVMRFENFKPDPEELYFLRPLADSKTFKGMLETGKEFLDWRHKVVDLEEDDGSSLTKNTLIMVCSPKHIQKEYRFWIVDGKIATHSLYKEGSRVIYRNQVDEGAIKFANMILDMWNPAPAFVLDIAMISDEFKIVEAQNINSSGLYDADVQKLVYALNQLT